MKKRFPIKLSMLFACLGLLLLSLGVNAQALTGIKTVPGDYPTVAAAVAALNANGVGTGGVTINVAAGHTETLTSTIVLTATGTQANPIVFQKSGAGANPLLTAYVGANDAAAATPDGIWAFVGSDYVTIDGINLLDPASNTTSLSTMEYGYGLFKASATDGSQHNTLQNCTVTLNRVNNTAWTFGHFGSIGVVVFNSKYNAATASLVVTAPSGSNSYNKFYSNTIQNGNAGIAFNGFAPPAPFLLGDTLNDVGGSSLATGNTILNFGGGVGAVNQASGIYAKDQWGFNVSYNTVNSHDGNGVKHPNILKGISLAAQSSFGAGATVRYNTVTIKGGGTSHTITGIECGFGGGSPSANLVDVSYNTLTGCSYTTATSGSYYLINVNGGVANTNVSNNVFTNDSTHNTSGSVGVILCSASPIGGTVNLENNTISGIRMMAAGSLTFYGINYLGGAINSSVNMRGNTFENITQAAGQSGTYAPLYASGGLGNGTYNIENNTFTNLTTTTVSNNSYLIYNSTPSFNTNVRNNSIVGSFTRTGVSGTFYAYYNAGTPSGGTGAGLINIYNNNFSNISCAGTTIFNGIYSAVASVSTIVQVIRKNTITNITGGFTGQSYGIYYNYGARGGRIDSNTISNFSAGGTLSGIGVLSNSANTDLVVANNVISELSTTGANQLMGLYFNNGTAFTANAYNNKIYNLSASHASGVVYGVNVSPATSTVNNITLYNNRISGLTAPAAHLATGIPNQVVGINAPMNAGNFNIFNNTVLVSATSTGVNFGTSALSVNAGSTLDLRNNILVNNSTPNGTGRTVVFRRGAGSLTTFAATSNNNILYAGDSTTDFHHLYNENNTLIDTVMSAYKLRMGPGREDSTQTENVVFLSTTGTDPNYLRVNPSAFTFTESSASRISFIESDANGTKRATFAGYAGTTGGLPDIGAVEGEYTGDINKQMIYNFSDIIQDTGIVARGSINNKVLRALVVTQRTYNAMHATQFKFTTVGTTNDSDIVSAKLYYTGSDSVFNANDLFGSAVSYPAGNFYFNGNKALAQDTNFFWLVYDVSNTAAAANLLDATGDSVVVDGVYRDFLTYSPVNARTVKAPLAGDYTVGISSTYDYARITDALTDLYTLGVSAPVRFILKDTAYKASTNEVFPLVLSNYAGRSAVNTVTIMPDAGVSCRISTPLAVPVFRFDNAEYFVIDGSQGGASGFVSGSNLKVVTQNSSSATIELRNESSNNMIRYVDVMGRNSTVLSINTYTPSGLICFQNTTGPNGNDNNTIYGCAVHPDDIFLPISGIYSWGTGGASNATNNDGNIIDSCDIYDYFMQATSSVASSGVYLGMYNSTWQIVNNRFYQTGTRTWSGSNTHRSIWIQSPPSQFGVYQSGFVITNNQIGGNSPVLGTGDYTILPSNTGHLYTAIDVNVGWGTPTLIQGNTISNIKLASSSTSIIASNGINMANGNVTCEGNTITNMTHITSSAFGGGVTGIRGANGGTYVIQNNVINNIKIDTTASTAVGEFHGINVLGTTLNATIQNNMVGDTALAALNSINNVAKAPLSTHLAKMYGILVNPSVASSIVNVEGNYVANMTTSYLSTAAGLTKGLVMSPGNNGIYSATNNTIFNLSAATRSVGTGANATLGGITVEAPLYSAFNVSNNTVHSLTLTDTSTTLAVRATGLFINSAAVGNNVFSRNNIHSISKQSANENEIISGIEIGGGNPVVVNNLVRLGIDSAGNSMTIPSAIYGIVGTAGTSGVYHNTVYIGGTGVLATALAKRTFAYIRTNTLTDDVRNNIFINRRQPDIANTGAGHFAVGLNSNTNLTQNYNILYADSVGVFNGVVQETVNNWKVASAVDANSLNSNPHLLNPTGDEYTVSLNINADSATAIEAYGQVLSAVGTDVDFAGNNRASLTPVDLGAYAGNYTPLDLAAPVISYTPLQNTLLQGDRVIAATITDATGVYQTPALAPRIYFKKASVGTYFSTTGVKTGGTAQNGTWNFTIDSAILGGVIGDDSIYYFIVGQDSSSYNNMGSTPGGVEGSNVGNISVYPALNGYKITAILSDTIYVGASHTLTSLTGVAGAFNYVNTSVLAGDVVFSITSDIEEPGTFALNNWAETGVGNYKVSFVPSDSVVRNITSTFRLSPSVSEAFIRLDRADRVTFDGSFAGSGRYIRLMNRDTLGSVINLTNDADGNTIANCIIEGIRQTNASANTGMINLLSTNVGGATGNDSNLIIGCLFRDTLGTGITHPNMANKPNIAIFSQGLASNGNDYTRIENNEFVNIRTSALHITNTGGDYWTIDSNHVYTTNDGSFTNFTHFFIQGGGGHMISNNSFGGTKVGRDGLAYTANSTGTSYAIRNSSSSPLPIYIDGNHIGNYYFPITGAGFHVMQMSGIGGAQAYITNNIIGGSNAWDTINHPNSCHAILVSQPAEIADNEISNIYKRTSNTTGYSTAVNVTVSVGALNIHDNYIHDIYHSYTTASLGAQGAVGIYLLPSASPTITIERNTISNIGSINGGATARGISMQASITGSLKINANKISNIFVTSANAAAGPIAIGIHTNNAQPTGGNVISNNYISLGSGTGRLVGISNAAGTSGQSYNVFNNSIFINGIGDTSSYGLWSGNLGGFIARNNLIYNKRTSTGNGRHLAIGTPYISTPQLMPLIQNNTFIVGDTAKLVEGIAKSLFGWDSINKMYGATNNKNWATDTLHVPADSLFTDTLTNDLSIVTTNSHAWYVNGKGLPMASVSGDNGTLSTVRSTTIATGASDIGADEFTPVSTPPMAYMDKLPAAGDSTLFYFASRKIAQLNWDFIGNLPSLVNAYYYSGVDAPNQIPGRTAMNAYWDFQTVDGSGYATRVTLMQDSANFGDVVNPNNLSVAHYDGALWTKDSFTVVNNIDGFFTSGVNMMGLGIYTGTDGSNNPLPVKMTTFTAKVNNGDVIVDWKTASETNNLGFDIERSLDGRSFELVGFVKGAGNSNTVLSYMYNDKAAFAKTSAQVLYYRLKQVDMNGSFNYSTIARVSLNDKAANAVSAYPNPFTTEMSISFNATAESKAQVRILNIQGMVVADQTANASKGMNRIELESLTSLPKGMYFVELTVNGETTVVKVVKN